MLKYKIIKGNKIHSTAIINWKNVLLGKNNECHGSGHIILAMLRNEFLA